MGADSAAGFGVSADENPRVIAPPPVLKAARFGCQTCDGARVICAQQPRDAGSACAQPTHPDNTRRDEVRALCAGAEGAPIVLRMRAAARPRPHLVLPDGPSALRSHTRCAPGTGYNLCLNEAPSSWARFPTN